MDRAMLLFALMAGTLAPFDAHAESRFVLKSVTVDLPAGDRTFPTSPGSDLADRNCIVCHSAGMVLNQPPLSKAQWGAEVNKMRTVYKAPIDAGDVDRLVDFLVSIRGPK